MVEKNLISMLMMAGSPQGQAGAAPVNPIIHFLPFLLMFLIFYFLLIRPQKKKEADHRKRLEALKKGDKVVTTGGIMGVVLGVKEKSVVLKVGDGEQKIEFVKTSISTVNNDN